MMRFRFDDVCINADMKLIGQITDYLYERFPDCEVIYGVSPLVHDMSGGQDPVSRQRIFPKIFNAYSNHKLFYEVDKAGIPQMDNRVTLAGHGIVHVDHRLLTREAQEMSILISTSLVDGKMFIPPFNKWNKDTELICMSYGIELIKFEDGWLSMEHNTFDDMNEWWYLHAREFTMEKIRSWFG